MAQDVTRRVGAPGRQTVLVTGPTGYIGRAMIAALLQEGYSVRAALRQNINAGSGDVDKQVRPHVVGDIGPTTDWKAALNNVQAVVHLAARVHVMDERAPDPLAEYRRVNTHGTLRLAAMAALSGVRRFVYVSTVKVNGEETAGAPFRESDPPRPCGPYAVSKWEAEQGLLRIAADTGMEIVIARPPLVYGPGVGGNFRAMLKWIQRGIPLPLASIRNQRSLVGLGNLVNLLLLCVFHPAAAGEIFLVADGEDLSTPELIQRMALALDRKPRLFPFPVPLLSASARLLGMNNACDRLCGSLTVDSGKARRLLAWNPPSSVNEELRNTAEWYQRQTSLHPAMS
ncbi:MAG: NAD-dependent epimerase/dehydratase family protein [Gammaproteobacteria bacterium]|nr:NAD-dependent epimerase/dehydratase family protein [Gammaproteobacteria bacterium]